MRRTSLFALLLIGCASSRAESPTSASGSRTYRMGFSPIPPRLTTAEVLRTADEMSRHADAAFMVLDIPWAALLADTSAALLVRRDQLQLARLLAQRGVPLVVQLEPANGLDRSAESAALVTMSNAAEAERRAAGSTTKLMVSVQVDVAWGRLPGGSGSFVGSARDHADFPFVDVLGLSSYPYLAGFRSPEDIPLDYYARLTADAPLPMIVTEGGWSSGSVASVTSSPEMQARYIRRQMQLADAAKLIGVFQITFTDLDVSTYNLPAGSILPLFAQLGLVDASYRPKPALAVWDSVLARR